MTLTASTHLQSMLTQQTIGLLLTAVIRYILKQTSQKKKEKKPTAQIFKVHYFLNPSYLISRQCKAFSEL